MIFSTSRATPTLPSTKRSFSLRLWRAGLVPLLVALFSALAQAQLTNISYTTTSDGHGGLTITGFSASGSGPLTIPGTINGLTVTGIGAGAFTGTSLSSVTIPGSITTIGDEAFDNCISLTSITVSSQNTAYSSSVDGVLFNKNQTTLVEYPAGGSSTYTIPSTVTTLGNFAFAACTGLTSVSIPASVTSLGQDVFGGCIRLPAFVVDPANTSLSSSVDGVLFNKSQTTLIQYPAGKSDTGYTIPGSVTSIVTLGFDGNAYLTSVSIPGSVTSIGDAVFANLSRLTSITVSPQNTAYSNSVDGVLFNKSQSTLVEYPAGTGNSSYTIPNGVTTIQNFAFTTCASLTSVTIPGSVTSVGNLVFFQCGSLIDAVFLGNAPTMGSSVFQATGSGFAVSYFSGATGFTSPAWQDSSRDSYPAVNAGPFGGGPLGSGWYSSAWFGTYNSTYYPWINDSSLGFIYVSTSDNTNLYLYIVNGSSGSMGWLYTIQTQFPNVYSFSKGTWLYYGSGTGFYNYKTAAWETY